MATVTGIGLARPSLQHVIPAEQVDHLIAEIEQELATLTVELAEATRAADAAEQRLRTEAADPVALGRTMVQLRQYLDQLTLEVEAEIDQADAEAREEAAEVAPPAPVPAPEPLARVLELTTALPARSVRHPAAGGTPAEAVAAPTVAPAPIAEPALESPAATVTLPGLPPRPPASGVVEAPAPAPTPQPESEGAGAPEVAAPAPVIAPAPVAVQPSFAPQAEPTAATHVDDTAFWGDAKPLKERALGVMPIAAFTQVAAVVLILIVILLRIG